MTADGAEPRMTPFPPDTGPRRHPDVFDVAGWQRHAGDLLDTWLEESSPGLAARSPASQYGKGCPGVRRQVTSVRGRACPGR
jgi:hypothetical protein